MQTVQIPQCSAKDPGLSPVGDAETLKHFPYWKTSTGKSGGASSMLWPSALFKTFILDLKALLPFPTIAYNSI